MYICTHCLKICRNPKSLRTCPYCKDKNIFEWEKHYLHQKMFEITDRFRCWNYLYFTAGKVNVPKTTSVSIKKLYLGRLRRTGLLMKSFEKRNS